MSDWELYADVTISVSVHQGDELDIHDEDRLSAAFGAAEKMVRDALDRERFQVKADL